MTSLFRLALLSGALTLGGCGEQQPSKKTLPKIVEVERGSGPVAQATTPPSPPRTPAAVAGENDGSPDITPAPLTPEAARSEKGARANLLAWARGIELREFDQAWELMGDAAKAQVSKAQFVTQFGSLHDISVATPAGTVEGAAGSSYYTVPTIVTGTRANGTRATLKGEVVLRRVNDVEGATPAQLAWHIVSVSLTPG